MFSLLSLTILVGTSPVLRRRGTFSKGSIWSPISVSPLPPLALRSNDRAWEGTCYRVCFYNITLQTLPNITELIQINSHTWSLTACSGTSWVPPTLRAETLALQRYFHWKLLEGLTNGASTPVASLTRYMHAPRKVCFFWLIIAVFPCCTPNTYNSDSL